MTMRRYSETPADRAARITREAAVARDALRLTPGQLRHLRRRGDTLVQVGWWYEDDEFGDGVLCWSSNVAEPPTWRNARNVRPAYDLQPSPGGAE